MHQFSKRRVLVVEDEVLIGLDVKDTLVALGCQVLGPIATVAAAILAVTTNRLDATVLDINLGKELSFPIADALIIAAVPFIFLNWLQPRNRACRTSQSAASPQAVPAESVGSGVGSRSWCLKPHCNTAFDRPPTRTVSNQRSSRSGLL